MTVAARRIGVTLVLASLLLTPGCTTLFELPGMILGGIFELLFFWADAPEAVEASPDAPALASAPGSPVPLAAAVERALPLVAGGSVFVVAADGPLPEPAASPPHPGAVPVRIPLSDTNLTDEAREALAKAGIRLVR